MGLGALRFNPFSDRSSLHDAGKSPWQCCESPVCFVHMGTGRMNSLMCAGLLSMKINTEYTKLNIKFVHMHSSVGSLIVMCIDFIAKKKKKRM